MYLIILAVLFIGSYIKPGKSCISFIKKHDLAYLYVSLVFLALLFLSAFRYNIGTDYPTYVRSVLFFKTNFTFSWMNFEPGFIILNRIVGQFTQSGQLIIIVSSVVTIILFHIAIKKYSVDPASSVFLFYALYMYCMSFNLIRQFIAIGIVMVSIKAFIEERFLKCVLCIAIAMLFHASAIIVLPLFFLQKMRMTINAVIGISFAAVLISVFYDKIIGIVVRILPQYARYLNDQGGSSIVNVLVMVFSLAMLLVVRGNGVTGEKDKKTLNFYIAAVLMGLVITSFSGKIVFFARASYYFFNILIFAIPFCWSKLKGKKDYLLWKYCSILLAVFLFVHLVNAGTGGITPYTLWDFSQL